MTKKFLSFYAKFAQEGGLYYDYLKKINPLTPITNSSTDNLKTMFIELKDCEIKLKDRYSEIKDSERLMEQAEKMLLDKFFLDVNWLLNDLEEYFILNGETDFVLENLRYEIDEFDSNGRSILIKAVDCGNLELAEKLLAQGANPFLKCNLNETPFSVAIEKGYIDLVQNFIKLYDEDGGLRDIIEAPSEEDFYRVIALHMSSLLGNDQDSIKVCRSYIEDNYDALGMNPDDLTWGEV